MTDSTFKHLTPGLALHAYSKNSPSLRRSLSTPEVSKIWKAVFAMGRRFFWIWKQIARNSEDNDRIRRIECSQTIHQTSDQIKRTKTQTSYSPCTCKTWTTWSHSFILQVFSDGIYLCNHMRRASSPCIRATDATIGGLNTHIRNP